MRKIWNRFCTVAASTLGRWCEMLPAIVIASVLTWVLVTGIPGKHRGGAILVIGIPVALCLCLGASANGSGLALGERGPLDFHAIWPTLLTLGLYLVTLYALWLSLDRPSLLSSF